MKKDWFKSIPKSILVVCLITVLLVIVVVIAWKPLRALNLQARGGGKIEDYIQTYSPDFDNYFACQIPAFIDLPEDEGLAEAVSLLEKAQAMQPENAQTHLLLGRAYCLQENYEGAIEAFEGYSQQRPDNPLGDLERAFTHFTLALTVEDISDVERSDHETQSRLILVEEGYTGIYFFEEGDTAFKGRSYLVAWYWYKLGHVYKLPSKEISFRTLIMDQVYMKTCPDIQAHKDVESFIQQDSMTISPSKLFKLGDGETTSLQDIEGKTTAVLWSTNSIIGILVDVVDEGTYFLSIEAFDRPPEPTLIEMTIDFKQVMIIELSKGDNSWSSFGLNQYLEKGSHFLAFRLTNDANINGVDRNGYIGEITIKRILD